MLGPALGDREVCLDRFAEADLVGEDDVASDRRGEGEKSDVDLMGVEIDTSGGERFRESLFGRAFQGEVAGGVLAVVSGEAGNRLRALLVSAFSASTT